METIKAKISAQNIQASTTIPQWIKGADGDDRVYVGETEPTDDKICIWINPDGQDDATLVTSVNGKTGDVELDAEDVGALPEDTPIPTVEYLSNSEIQAIWNNS